MWLHFGNIYLGSFEVAFIIYISLTSWLSPHFSLLTHLFFIATHLILRECSFLHFITYILGSLIFERMLNLCVYTYKPWGFIYSSLSDSYFPKIMYYKTYVSCIYAKILIFHLSRWQYFLNILLTYDLCINTEVWTREPKFWIIWISFIFFIDFSSNIHKFRTLN